MLTRVTDGVLVHQSPLIQNNSVVVRGDAGVLLIDPGVTGEELRDLAQDVGALEMPVVAGFATHPDWDHVLWSAELGDATRYGTERCAAAMRDLLVRSDWRERVADVLPPEIADEIPMGEFFGRITALPTDSDVIPWNGPRVRVIEHQAHAPGHAALLVEESRVLVAGDMLSDVLVPMLSFRAAQPIDDYLAALDLFERLATDVDYVIPGHGSVGGADEVRTRIALDRAYVIALRDGIEPDDPRIGESAKPGWEWVSGVHAGQVERYGALR